MDERDAAQPLRVSGLYVYPVKSLGGYAVEKSAVLPKGLAFDRRWMLVDEQHQFMTQRTNPRLALFRVEAAAGGFTVAYHDQRLHVPFEPAGDPLEARVWDDVVRVEEVGRMHSEWFSAMLGQHCRLVFFPEAHPRQVDRDYAPIGVHTSLSDGYPLLVIGQSSLDDLNSRLEEPVPMNRFRPSLAFTGGLPFEEDQWSRFRINEVELQGVKPCARCVMTTINQQTGEKGKEPLATLQQYRTRANKVLFGMNVLVLAEGNIAVGDEIHLMP
jgi:hypothetical protein